MLHFYVVLNLRRIEGAKKDKKMAKCSSKGGRANLREIRPQHLLQFSGPPPPLKKGQNVLQKGGGQKPEKYVRRTCYFSPPPLQFSKILLKWGGKAKKYCTVTSLRPPPNRVTKGVVIIPIY